MDAVVFGEYGPDGWIVSSFSTGTGMCVEVLFGADRVWVRDSKYWRNADNDPAKQPVIAIPVEAWTDFLELVVNGDFCSWSPVLASKPGATGGVALSGGGVGLAFTDAEWSAFRSGVANGEFAPPAIEGLVRA